MPSASEAFLPLADLFARIPSEREALVHGTHHWTFGKRDARSSHLADGPTGKGSERPEQVAHQLAKGPALPDPPFSPHLFFVGSVNVF